MTAENSLCLSKTGKDCSYRLRYKTPYGKRLSPYRPAVKQETVLGNEPHRLILFHRHDPIDAEIAHQLRNGILHDLIRRQDRKLQFTVTHASRDIGILLINHASFLISLLAVSEGSLLRNRQG